MQMNQQAMKPRLSVIISDTNKGAIVAGFDEDAISEHSRLLVLQGYIPVSQEHTLMEEISTGNRGHYKQIIFIHNPS